MSETSSHRSSLLSVLVIFALFGLFLAVMYYVYVPRHSGAYTGDGVRTAEQRQQMLAELTARNAQIVKSYGWVDQNAGVVQLPLERAMELTVQHYAAKK